MNQDLMLILLSIEQLNKRKKHKFCTYFSGYDGKSIRCALVRCSSCLLNLEDGWGEPKYVEQLIEIMEML
ncbi:hypothetical protein H0088_004094 [Salmonella enterica]|nr:hypothetical protein [Salmonella enterica]